MAATADVVIVGAGIVGASVAFHLTRLGCRNVLLVEREPHQGRGSTGKSMGGVRAQFATEINIRMSLYSIPFFARFKDETGHPAGYKPHGYLFVASSARHLDYLRTNRARQMGLGLAGVEMLGARDVLEMVPQLHAANIMGGSFCPTDGFVDPHSVMTGFTQAALGRGARLWRGVEVSGMVVAKGRVAAVETSAGRVETPAVVNAAGPWAAAVARAAGTDLPVEPLRRMLVPTEPFPGLPEKLPMVIDMATGFHFRREGLGLLLAWADPQETPGFKCEFDPEFIEKILTRAVAFMPCFSELQVNPKRAWWGLYEVSPDHHAILGPSREVEGLYFANGFSGHGVMHSPATGCAVAEWVLYGEPRTIDARPLEATRFTEGRRIEETAVL
jgi:glycine/D-amino acid oxidase-like deaminating enzyme